jgi:hypothetical protein
MSQLSDSLERRIQQLAASIEAQKAELIAYERVLQMELMKEGASAEITVVEWEVPLEIMAEAEREGVIVLSEEPAAVTSEAPVTGNKTALVEQIVTSRGSAGASPKDVDAYFTSRHIERSKNLVYNTLSYLVAHKRLERRDGKYFVAGNAVASKKRGPAKKKASAEPAKKKRTLSPEGLKRIQDALKKRWALKKAADTTSGKPATKKATKKK